LENAQHLVRRIPFERRKEREHSLYWEAKFGIGAGHYLEIDFVKIKERSSLCEVGMNVPINGPSVSPLKLLRYIDLFMS